MYFVIMCNSTFHGNLYLRYLEEYSLISVRKQIKKILLLNFFFASFALFPCFPCAYKTSAFMWGYMNVFLCSVQLQKKQNTF